MNIEEQIHFKPEIIGEVPSFDNTVVGGMGGSALAPRTIFFLDPTYRIWLHNDYGLPEKYEDNTLFVAISYSGNTAETLSFVKEALSRDLPLAIITSGGKLLEIAKEKKLAHVVVPGGNQPRDSVVYMLKSLLHILDRQDLLGEIDNSSLDIDGLNREGKIIAGEMKENIPLIYSSRTNQVLGYIWKIILNETAKTAAFNNIFPELTHNEIQSIQGNCQVLMLKDRGDNDGVQREINAFEKVIGDKIKITEIKLPGGGVKNLLTTLEVARAAGHELARVKGVDPDNIAVIEAFKKNL